MPLKLNEEVERRFWSKVDKGKGRECWLWLGGRTATSGYGRMNTLDGYEVAHRISYTILKGTIPDGQTLDHLCRNKLCVNPAHLEPVSLKENILRGIAPSAKNAEKIFCKRGHELTTENTRINRRADGRFFRSCKTCEKIVAAKWRVEDPKRWKQYMKDYHAQRKREGK